MNKLISQIIALALVPQVMSRKLTADTDDDTFEDLSTDEQTEYKPILGDRTCKDCVELTDHNLQ